ncbi:MAG: DEAD/DEAH box helicase [Pseudonocardiaceae bacterium]
MLAVHGFWSDRRGLCLWAEDTERAVKSPSQAVRIARPHPFAAPCEAVSEIHPGKHGVATLLLPSLRTAPLDSPELVRVTPRPAMSSAPTLLSWLVPVVWFDPAATLAVLDEPADSVRYGASMRFLAEVATFAGELVARGRVLATLDRSEQGPSARWRPVLQGPDIVALHALIAAMPPVCRAESDLPIEVAGQNPHELVLTALHALVDAAMRERLWATGEQPCSLLDLLPPRRGRHPKRRPAAEAWLAALSTTDGRFDAEPDDLDELESALAAWADFGVGQTGPARAAFRLCEIDVSEIDLVDAAALDPASPDDAGLDDAADPVRAGDLDGQVVANDRWRLEFLLQSIDDPSLLVPADLAWTSGGGLRRWMERPAEVLLAELGRASRIYSELAPALRQRRPDSLELDAEGAYRFLSTAAGALDEAGFGVLLPSWWDRRRRLGLALSASSTPTEGVVTKQRKFGRDQLVQFQWQLAVGDEVLTEEEIAALAAAKAPLVRLRGQWVAVDAEQLRRGLEFLRRNRSEQKTAGEILALAARHPADAETPLPLNCVQASGWLGDLLSGAAERSLSPLTEPDGFQASLRPYQQRGLSWLAFLSSLGLGACLADDMGLGKTVQLLALESLLRADEPEAGPTLLLCPMSLVGNWQREAAKFAPGLRVYAHHGPARRHGDELRDELAGAHLVVTTYATATRDIDELAGYDWRRVVLDEAQAVKNSLSRSAKAVRRLRAEHRIALTGTPMENRLAELWSVMDFLNPGILGSAETFRARYAVPVERHGHTEPAQRLRTITRPYVLRRLKTDPQIIDDLPDKIEIKQYCQLTTEQASLYQVVVDDMMVKIENSEGIERRGNVLAAMAKLKQVCNHPAQLLHDRSAVGRRSGKVIRLEEILEEVLAEGDKVLCFTQFTEFAELLLPYLSARFGQEVLYLHGGTPKTRRDEMVQRFQSDSGPAVFLLSLKAGGTGLNLTAATHVVHLDRWWNPAVENQATDRAFRIGQNRTVQVRKFICVGTLEEKIDAMIEEKKALADLVITDGERWMTELSTSSLREVFALSEGAVGE